MEAEVQNKHIERRKIKKELRSISANLRITLGVVLFNEIKKKIIKKKNVAMKSTIKAITYRHEKRLCNLRKLQQHYVNTKSKQHPVKQIIHSFRSYVLLPDEEIALSHGLNQQIPSTLNKIDIGSELKKTPEENISTLETKLRSTCKKYTRIKVPYKYQQTVKQLSEFQNIVTMKQNKGLGVVIMGKL